MGYRVVIDRDACAASHMCTRIAPTVFGVDGDGLTTVIDERPGDTLRPVVEEALQRCPQMAIDLVRTDD